MKSEDYTILILSFLAVISLGFLGFSILSNAVDATDKANTKQAILMKQCLDDGKKEYECVALLKSR